jgi:hypothetical protein
MTIYIDQPINVVDQDICDDLKFKLLSNGSCNSSYIAAIYCLIYFFFLQETTI